jgi:hypothetical protein
MAGWENFFLAQAGASAALVGLIFVAVSINLTRILSFPALPNRAFQALIILLAILIVSSLMLIPGQSATIAGIQILVAGIVLWITVIWLNLQSLGKTEIKYRRAYIISLAFSQVAVVPYIVSGIVLLTSGVEGFYWLVPAVVLSYAKGILDAWILLVEINR